ncbi:hypothetical protein GE09DRAFT_549761 [Coniochaeta sp. 2T2.1]|nr:hypothetical protein GE09DRAFT_549761 [Coniochaeta sp. 2T2.1]
MRLENGTSVEPVAGVVDVLLCHSSAQRGSWVRKKETKCSWTRACPGVPGTRGVRMGERREEALWSWISKSWLPGEGRARRERLRRRRSSRVAEKGLLPRGIIVLWDLRLETRGLASWSHGEFGDRKGVVRNGGSSFIWVYAIYPLAYPAFMHISAFLGYHLRLINLSISICWNRAMCPSKVT